MFEVILLMVLVPIIWCLSRWWRVKRYWAERGVPHYPPHPIMGSLTFLQRQNPTIWMRKVYNDFRTPYVGMWLFWRPALIVNCPDIARKILIKDSDNFRNRFVSSGKSDPTGALNLFTVKDPMWTYMRRRLTTAFTSAKLRSSQNLSISKANDLVERIKNEMKKDELINLRGTCVDYTTDVIGETAFGIKCHATLTGDSVMKKVTREFMEFNVFRGLSWSSIFFFPELVDIFGFSFFPKHTVEYLRQLLRTVVQQRGGYDKETKESKDLLDALLKMRHGLEEDGKYIGMTEDIILAHASTFVLGGFDTSGAALTWAIYELAFQPELQERLYLELLEAKAGIGCNDFDPATLAGLTYLNAVIKETLRKHAPMSWLDRVAANDYQIDGKLTISAGTTVYVNAAGMHMDPDYFPEPEKFNPDRFLPENEKNIKPYTFMPFGEGPRICIGMRFAYQTMWYALSSIFLNYQVSSVPESPEPNNCSIEKKGMFYLPDGKLSVTFTLRQ